MAMEGLLCEGETDGIMIFDCLSFIVLQVFIEHSVLVLFFVFRL